jgi:hypothetical protein
MTAPSKSTWLLIGLAIAVGLAEPYLELAWKCREGFETSEACVWGRSYFPLSRAAGLLLIAPLTFGVLWFSRRVWMRRRQ